MLFKHTNKMLAAMIIVVVLFSVLSLVAVATEIQLQNGELSVSDTKNTLKNSNGTLTATAKGSLISKATNTITITNKTTSESKISFDYTVSSANSFKIDDVTQSNSGSYSKVLSAGESITVVIQSKSGLSGTTVTLTMSNISLVKAEVSDLEILFDGALGSVTVNGTAVSSGYKEESLAAGTVRSLVAVPSSSATFLGWINTENNALLSTNASYTWSAATNTTAKAVFVNANSSAHFLIDQKYIEDDLNEAVGLGSTVVLMNNATLPAGNYTIPAGVTLLIPFDASNTLYTSAPAAVEEYTTPTVYRTLTMADGANITVNGAISVSAKQSAKYSYNGQVHGPYGRIQMNTGSKITVNSGAKLYAWGYITGSGSVEAKSSATVYENFQVADYRGGDATSQMVGDKATDAFPMNQYYLQNIEVPLTLNAGAIEKAYFSVAVSFVGVKGSEVPVIGGADSVFSIDSGYVIKDYIEGTGRSKYTINGNVSLNPIEIEIQVSGYSPITIASANYDFPIPGHMTIDVAGGTISINQDLAMLPGSEIYVRKDASVMLTTGARIVMYDLTEWNYESGKGYSGEGEAEYVTLKFVPGGNGSTGRHKDALIQIEGTIDASAGEVYSTASGADISGVEGGKLVLPTSGESSIHVAIQDAVQSILGTQQEISTKEIPIYPAKLKHGDGTYVAVADYGAGTYYYSEGFWHKDNVVKTEPTCTAEGYTTHVCVICQKSYTTDRVAALGHTEVIDAAIDATCTESGLTQGVHCSVCDAVLTAQEIISALGHKWSMVPDANGSYDIKTCGACSLTDGKTLAIYCDKTKDARGFDVEYRKENYIWLNASFYINVPIADESKLLISTWMEENETYTVVSDEKKIAKLVILNAGTDKQVVYAVMRVLADDLTKNFQFIISYDGISSEVVTVNFKDLLNNKENDLDLINAMIAYGNAADAYFNNGTVESGTFLGEPSAYLTNTSLSFSHGPTGAFLTKSISFALDERIVMRVGATIDGLVVANGVVTVNSNTVTQIGLLVSAPTSNELTLENGAADQIYIAYSTGSHNFGNAQQPNVPTLPEGVTTEYTPDALKIGTLEYANSRIYVNFDLATNELITQKTVRPYIVIDGQILYGGQIDYGLANYVCNKSSDSDPDLANLVKHIWNYALVANDKAEWPES